MTNPTDPTGGRPPIAQVIPLFPDRPENEGSNTPDPPVDRFDPIIPPQAPGADLATPPSLLTRIPASRSRGKQKVVLIMAAGGNAPAQNALFYSLVINLFKEGCRVLIVRGGAAALNKPYPAGEHPDIREFTRIEAEFVDPTSSSITIGTTRADDPNITIMAENIRGSGADVTVVIGGDGGLTLARHLHEKGIPTIGIPKSMDGNVALVRDGKTERLLSLGFMSAVDHATDYVLKLKAKGEQEKKIYVVEVNGRNTGWIALGAASRTGVPCFIGEHPATLDDLKKAGESLKRKGGVILISESVRFLDGAGGEVSMFDLRGRVNFKPPPEKRLERALTERGVTARSIDLTPLLFDDDMTRVKIARAILIMRDSAKAQRRINIVRIPKKFFPPLIPFALKNDVLPLESIKGAMAEQILDGLVASHQTGALDVIVVTDELEFPQAPSETPGATLSPTLSPQGRGKSEGAVIDERDGRNRLRYQSREAARSVARFLRDQLFVRTDAFTATHLLMAETPSIGDSNHASALGKSVASLAIAGKSGIVVAPLIASDEIVEAPLASLVDMTVPDIRGTDQSLEAVRARLELVPPENRVWVIGTGGATRVAQMMQARHRGNIFVGITPSRDPARTYERLTSAPELHLQGTYPVSVVKPGSDEEKYLKTSAHLIYLAIPAEAIVEMASSGLFTVDHIRRLPPQSVIMHPCKDFDPQFRVATEILRNMIREAGREKDVHVVSIGGFISEGQIADWTPGNPTSMRPVVVGTKAEAVERVVWALTGLDVKIGSVGKWHQARGGEYNIDFGVGEDLQKIVDLAGPWKNIGILSTGFYAGIKIWQVMEGLPTDQAETAFTVAHRHFRRETARGIREKINKSAGVSSLAALPRGALRDLEFSSFVRADSLRHAWEETIHPFLERKPRDIDAIRGAFHRILVGSFRDFGMRNNRAGILLAWSVELMKRKIIRHPSEVFLPEDWKAIFSLSGPKNLVHLINSGGYEQLSDELKELALTLDAAGIDGMQIRHDKLPESARKRWEEIVLSLRSRVQGSSGTEPPPPRQDPLTPKAFLDRNSPQIIKAYWEGTRTVILFHKSGNGYFFKTTAEAQKAESELRRIHPGENSMTCILRIRDGEENDEIVLEAYPALIRQGQSKPLTSWSLTLPKIHEHLRQELDQLGFSTIDLFSVVGRLRQEKRASALQRLANLMRWNFTNQLGSLNPKKFLLELLPTIPTEQISTMLRALGALAELQVIPPFVQAVGDIPSDRATSLAIDLLREKAWELAAEIKGMERGKKERDAILWRIKHLLNIGFDDSTLRTLISVALEEQYAPEDHKEDVFDIVINITTPMLRGLPDHVIVEMMRNHSRRRAWEKARQVMIDFFHHLSRTGIFGDRMERLLQKVNYEATIAPLTAHGFSLQQAARLLEGVAIGYRVSTTELYLKLLNAQILNALDGDKNAARQKMVALLSDMPAHKRKPFSKTLQGALKAGLLTAAVVEKIGASPPDERDPALERLLLEKSEEYLEKAQKLDASWWEEDFNRLRELALVIKREGVLVNLINAWLISLGMEDALDAVDTDRVRRLLVKTIAGKGPQKELIAIFDETPNPNEADALYRLAHSFFEGLDDSPAQQKKIRILKEAHHTYASDGYKIWPGQILSPEQRRMAAILDRGIYSTGDVRLAEEIMAQVDPDITAPVIETVHKQGIEIRFAGTGNRGSIDQNYSLNIHLPVARPVKTIWLRNGTTLRQLLHLYVHAVDEDKQGNHRGSVRETASILIQTIHTEEAKALAAELEFHVKARRRGLVKPLELLMFEPMVTYQKAGLGELRSHLEIFLPIKKKIRKWVLSETARIKLGFRPEESFQGNPLTIFSLARINGAAQNKRVEALLSDLQKIFVRLDALKNNDPEVDVLFEAGLSLLEKHLESPAGLGEIFSAAVEPMAPPFPRPSITQPMTHLSDLPPPPVPDGRTRAFSAGLDIYLGGGNMAGHDSLSIGVLELTQPMTSGNLALDLDNQLKPPPQPLQAEKKRVQLKLVGGASELRAPVHLVSSSTDEAEVPSSTPQTSKSPKTPPRPNSRLPVAPVRTNVLPFHHPVLVR